MLKITQYNRIEASPTKGFAPLFRMVSDRINAFVANKGYNADIEAVIPARAKDATRSP